MDDYENETRAPRLLAATWSLTITSGVFLALRMYCKRRRSTGLWWDDHLMIAAWFSLLISASINTFITTLGMGRHYSTISPENKIEINKVTILVALFAIMSSGLSKTSFCVTLYRLFSDKWMRLFLLFVVVTTNLFLNSVWVTGYLKCQPIGKVWDSSVPGTCWDKQKLSKWQTFASYYSSIIDFVLAFLPWKTLLGMTMPLREKIGVTVAMSMVSRVDLTIWTLAEPAVTIMAASLPVLRMLYREFRSSQRSYYNNDASKYGRTNDRTGNQTGRRNTVVGTGTNKPHKKGNSVMVMSTSGWQESQEALQRDVEAGTSRSGSGRTKEVTVETSPSTPNSAADSFEMVSFEKDRFDKDRL
ncbi:hypothetical protein PG996_007430 [Apiospora saccharicola]|uniref:Rhodopsin domain-containing protein n=1 Tax=Apiospora saccharicola TaxID=335842 RepID=A0ABR1VAW5_9PEZI